MSKIIEAINVMVSNQDKIDAAIQGQYESEIFFRYQKKHKWSILKSENGEYYLHYYPVKTSLEELASWPDEAWHEFGAIVSYNSKDLATKEAKESLRELYSIVTEKVFGMDEVLEDIIKSDANW